MDDYNNIFWLDQNRAAEETFRWNNQLLSEDHLGLALLRIPSPERPRTSSWTGCSGSFQSPDDTQPMKFAWSEGPTTQPSRAPRLPRSPSDGLYSTPSNYNRRIPPVPAWQIDASNPASQSGRKRRREIQPKCVDVTVHEPGEFVASSDPAVLHETLANDTPANYYDQTRLSIDTDPMFSWSLSDGPPTPATALTDTSTISSQMMSRDGSINSLLTQNFNMLRVNSNFSFSGEDNNAALDPTDFNLEEFLRESALYYQSNQKYFVTHDQDASATSSFNFSLNSSDEFSFHPPTSSHSTQVMKRLSSTQSSESDSLTSQTRSSRRHQEQIRQAINCPIAPKQNASERLPTATEMVRLVSEDGSVQVKAAIDRNTSYQRPQHPKLYCQSCEDHPDGFRGDHELQRHMNRAHPSKIRKLWVCEDLIGDGKFLENCKACRTGKRYNAYYNAAAHLRRAHFNPRKRGRKARTEAEKRGGKGGGNWPPMDNLKERWMREIEEPVNGDSPPYDEADAEDEQQGEQELLPSPTEQPLPSSVSLSSDDHSSNHMWPEFVQYTTDGLTNATNDSASNIPSTCYISDTQKAFVLPEMEAFLQLEDFRPQPATSYII